MEPFYDLEFRASTGLREPGEASGELTDLRNEAPSSCLPGRRETTSENGHAEGSASSRCRARSPSVTDRERLGDQLCDLAWHIVREEEDVPGNRNDVHMSAGVEN